MREITVKSSRGHYPVRIGPGLLEISGAWNGLCNGRHILVVSDAHVAPLYLAQVCRHFQGHPFDNVILPSGEKEKNLARFGELMERLAALGAGRDALVIALGGGVISDLAGFAAASWMRGVACLIVPTTLLAMVDAAIGGKTAINLAAGKNLAGAFHPPIGVIADIGTLATLPPREFRSGLAEIVKYAAIRDREFFVWLENHAEDLLWRQPEVLIEAIERSCRHKAEIVAHDEMEQGERALLNFGHTFGHAIEAATEYRDWSHGEAVAIGMVLAARLSARLGLASEGDTERLAALLSRLQLPVALPVSIEGERLWEAMRLDKKILAGRLRLILWHGIGQAEVVAGVSEADVRALIGIEPLQ